MGIGQNLNFNMARLDHKFFNEDAVVTKGVTRLIHRRAHAVRHIGRTVNNPHTFAAAAGRRLDHHRIADSLCGGHRLIYIADRPICSGHTRYAG